MRRQEMPASARRCSHVRARVYSQHSLYITTEIAYHKAAGGRRKRVNRRFPEVHVETLIDRNTIVI